MIGIEQLNEQVALVTSGREQWLRLDRPQGGQTFTLVIGTVLNTLFTIQAFMAGPEDKMAPPEFVVYSVDPSKGPMIYMNRAKAGLTVTLAAIAELENFLTPVAPYLDA